jgi:hypothetical protein
VRRSAPGPRQRLSCHWSTAQRSSSALPRTFMSTLRDALDFVARFSGFRARRRRRTAAKERRGGPAWQHGFGGRRKGGSRRRGTVPPWWRTSASQLLALNPKTLTSASQCARRAAILALFCASLPMLRSRIVVDASSCGLEPEAECRRPAWSTAQHASRACSASTPLCCGRLQRERTRGP